jgi:hypothetical protein
VLDIVIDKPDGKKAFRKATLDTAAELNIVAESALKGLNHLAPYDWENGTIEGLGASFTPKRGVKIRWREKRKKKSYESDFAILDDSRSKSFDMILGNEFIEQHQIFTRNRAVLFVALAGNKSSNLTPIASS